MNWTYPAAANDEGIYEMGRRLAVELGRMPDATSFTYDPHQMLRITRRVEAAAKGGRLLVGFQTAAKFDVEAERYQQLLAAGTCATVFGTGRPAVEIEGIDYREVPADTRRLENQWFLVSDGADPVAFVSWELGDSAAFGVGGAGSPGKRFVGFVSDDPEVVAILVAALAPVTGIDPSPGRDDAPPAPEPDARATEIIAEVEAFDPPTSGAAHGAVVVPIGRGESHRALVTAMAIARAEGRDLVVVDRSTEGVFSSPYASVRSDDELRPRRDALFTTSIARREGHAEAASAISAAEMLGIHAGGWFPTSAGADGLDTALHQFKGALLVVPASVRKPTIGERIRGMSLESLERLHVPVIVAE